MTRLPTHPPANPAREVVRWSITFANGDTFSEFEWCEIDKFERQRMLLVRPPATFHYAAHLLTTLEETNDDSISH